MAIEIVDLPMDSMVMSHSFWYVYQRVPVVAVAGDGPARVRLPRILRAKKNLVKKLTSMPWESEQNGCTVYQILIYTYIYIIYV